MHERSRPPTGGNLPRVARNRGELDMRRSQHPRPDAHRGTPIALTGRCVLADVMLADSSRSGCEARVPENPRVARLDSGGWRKAQPDVIAEAAVASAYSQSVWTEDPTR
jgi:hypothetical protein